MKLNTKLKKIIFSIISILLIFLIAFSLFKTYIEFNYPIKYEEETEKYSEEFDVPQNLLLAVIKTESSFSPDAVSNVGAVGLTQIMPNTFEWIKFKLKTEDNFEDLKDAETNIKYGAFLLGYLLDEFENPECAIAAYHAGRGNVNKWLNDKAYSKDGEHLDKIPIPETAHYVRKVMRNVNIYNSINPISDERTDK